MADESTCLKNAQIINPKAQLCSSLGVDWDWICGTPDQQSSLYKFCHCQPPYQPPAGQGCPNGPNSPQSVYYDKNKVCYCCCSCFAWGTEVATPEGNKAIQTLVIGDPVLAAGTSLEWRPYAVEWSDGIPPGPDHAKVMMTLYFQLDGETESVVATPDQVFMLHGGKLQRTEYLVPGRDQLVAATTGAAVPIVGIETGVFNNGVHHIATTEDVATNVDGHLLNVHGLVVGDWALQIADIEGGGVGDATIATIAMTATSVKACTAAFMARHTHLVGDTYSHFVDAPACEKARPAAFLPYSKMTSGVPDEAKRFFTEKQAEDIFVNNPPAPPQSTAGQDIAFNLFSTLQGFYPDINFSLEWSSLLPNAYSWFTLNVPFILLNGGLVRSPGMNYNTLAVILAHEIAHLYGGAPTTPDGKYSCEGQADYSAVKNVLPHVFLEPSRLLDVVTPGIEGVEALFNFINPDNRKGVPGQTCDGISIDCRREALWAPLNARGLPECAGGRKIQPLDLVSAVAQADPTNSGTMVVLTFNQAVNRNAASKADAYTFTPAVTVARARVPAEDQTVVQIFTALDSGKAYKVTVQNVISVDGTPLNPAKSTADVLWKTGQ